jgi:hypothetical protein
MPIIDKTSTSTIFNSDTINPRDLTLFNAFRGVTDFTNINQFSQFETGYQALFVLQMPWFMEELEPKLTESFRHMLEYEFRGLDGLPDYSTDTMAITDGINEMRLINKVTYDTSVTIQSSYFEKTGSLITRWSEMYLTGIKDKNSQAKTYHGLIKNNRCPDPGPDKEIFTMLYVVTDNTMYRLERAVLLANCQLTKAETSMYNGSRDSINNKELSIEWNCFPIMNNAVDAAAKRVLEKVNGIGITYTPNGEQRNDGGHIQDTYLTNKNGEYYTSGQNGQIIYSELDSTEYQYGVMYNSASTNKDTALNKGEGMVRPTDLGKYFINP